MSLPVAAGIAIVVVGVMLGGLMSGLALGLMSLDIIGLRVVIAIGDESDKKHAGNILPLRKLGNWLLCTLVLGNTLLNVLVSIHIDDLLSGGIWGIIGPTAVIFLFAELLPQALCYKYSLCIGSISVPFVWFVLVILSPVAWPTSFLINRIVGSDASSPQSAIELQESLVQHAEIGAISAEQAEMTKKVARGILGFRNKHVTDILIPIENVFSLGWDEKVDSDLLREVHHSGFSRIPVYKRSKDNIVGVLHCKDLLMIDSRLAREAGVITVGEVVQTFGVDLVTFETCTLLSGVLDTFKNGACHMAVIVDDWVNAQGIMTLEDILKEILQDDIVDEDDLVHRGSLCVEHSSEDLCRSSTGSIANWLNKTGFGASVNETKRLSTSQLSDLLLQAPTMLYTGTKNDNVLCETGKFLDRCFLVLDGTVKVEYACGRCYSVGKYTVLAEKALYQNDYVPDFTAFVASSTAKILHITRDNYKLTLWAENPAVVNTYISKDEIELRIPLAL